MAVSPKFDQIVVDIQERFNVSKGVAIAIVVTMANLVGTTVLMASGICLASLAAGVPLFPPKA